MVKKWKNSKEKKWEEINKSIDIVNIFIKKIYIVLSHITNINKVISHQILTV